MLEHINIIIIILSFLTLYYLSNHNNQTVDTQEDQIKNKQQRYYNW